MYCYQCQETNKGQGCTVAGVCGKKAEVAELMDLYIHILRGISFCNLQMKKSGKSNDKIDKFIVNVLF